MRSRQLDRLLHPIALTLLATTALACGDDGGGDDGGTTTPVVECRPAFRPVVMVHGFLASADTWTAFARRFEANGYCPDHLYALDWNTITDRESGLDALVTLVDQAIAATGDAQVDLIGHSAGGGLAYQYLSDAARAAKVATYVNIAANPAPPGEDPVLPGPVDFPISTLNLASSADTVVPATEIPGAINITLDAEDHYQVATSARAFADVFSFLQAGRRPTTVELADSHPFDPDLPRVVAGKALTIGDNTPVDGWTVAIHEVDAATGARTDETPEATFTVAADGSWGPFSAAPDTHYEFHLTGPAPTDRPVHYYREPFSASDRFLRLRALPRQGSLVAALFSVIPFTADHVVLIAFTESQAVVSGRDTLVVAGETLSTPELASADKTAIAFFLFDENADFAAGGEVATFKNVSPVFLKAIDRVLSPSLGSIALTFNGRTLNVPTWASEPDGAIVATFD